MVTAIQKVYSKKYMIYQNVMDLRHRVATGITQGMYKYPRA